jgi:hypothetical protein
MRYLLFIGVAAVAALAAPVSAQFLGKPDSPPRSAPSVAQQFWAPKPSETTPYVAPNNVHWKLSFVVANEDAVAEREDQKCHYTYTTTDF